MSKFKTFIKRYLIEILLILFSLFFGFWLMFSTFSYEDGSMLIATKAWSDFASHIPLIRSFSFGDNFPPEYPLFSGEPIRYHFLFYLLVGMLEKTGLRIDYALNIPSALSFSALLIVVYFLAKTLFQSKWIGILSVVFLLLNGSLSFLEFFKNHPLSTNTINDVISNATFPSFAPYGKGIVSAFWNLNIYTNQRHLALPLAILFMIIFLVVKSEQERKLFSKYLVIVFGVLLGLLSFSHSSVFIMAYATLGILFLLLPQQRKLMFIMLLIGIAISLPRILFLKETANFIPTINLRYLLPNLTPISFLHYWFMNLGLFFLLIPIGVLLSSSLQKKVFLAFFSLFIIGHTIQFSPEVASNHKFFNVFLMVGNMFTAYLLVKLWRSHVIIKAIIPFLVLSLTLSGIIDFFPIKNDRFMVLPDYPINQDIKWIMNNTPKNAVFLNSSYLYNSASLAGRKIFLGWPYFSWSLGYNTLQREVLLKQLFNTNNLGWECSVLKENKISYIAVEEKPDPQILINREFFRENFEIAYKNSVSGLTVFNPAKRCHF